MWTLAVQNSDELTYIWSLYTCSDFPGLSRTKVIFQDFPGPGIFKKKIQDFPGLSRRRGNPVYSSSPLWTSMWLFRSWEHLNVFSYKRHLYGFLVRFLSTVNCTVLSEGMWRCKSFTANGAFVRFLSRMNQSVFFQRVVLPKALSAFTAPVFTAMSVHMCPQIMQSYKTFPAIATWVQVFTSVCLAVSI